MARKANILAFISMTAALAISPALADPAADTNNDGRISKAEFVNAANIRFSESDKNGDNFVSKEERDAHREFRSSERDDARFDRIDQNGDGVITREEFDAHTDMRHAHRESRRDINKDGQVDRQDRVERREKMRERMKERMDRPRGERHARFSPDTDGDGFVSRAEHDVAVEKMFDRLDVNGDGYLEKGEGKRRHKRRHSRH